MWIVKRCEETGLDSLCIQFMHVLLLGLFLLRLLLAFWRINGVCGAGTGHIERRHERLREYRKDALEHL